MSSEANGGLENFEGYYGSREMEKILRQLETGFVVTVISPKKKAENLSVRVIMETKELICIRVHGAKPELTINLSQVKDIRTGKKSADFDKCLEEGYKLDSKLCLVVLYGTAFNLKSLSFQAKDEKTFRILHEGLREVLREIDDNYYLEQKDRWVWKQFHTVMKADAYYAYCSGNTDDVRVAIKDIRGWFVRMNCKISSKQITQYCKKLKLRDKLSFNEFCFLFAEFLHPTKAIELRFMPYMSCSPKSKIDNDKRIGFEMIREFMEKEQKITLNPEDTRTLIVNFLNDQHRTVTDLHFTEKEFIDYLFSPENEIYDYSTMTDDMTQPLADYWIASSHNTYVTGNQVSSESSVEPYARCLRMGCRCVELDCHDGPDGRPIIYHGKTLTTKVKLVDVLHVIQENAFSSSEYPVILSIENHCSLMQQRLMAKMFHETFGESLLTEPIPNTEDRLPSPEQLKMKIIIKDKKLNEEDISKNADELRERRPSKIGRDDSSEEFGGEGEEKGTAQKSGILYLQDPATKKWQPYYCVLDDTNLILTPPKEDEEEEDDDDIYDFPYDDVYVGDEDDLNAQTWFHGSLGSKAAEALLSEHSSLKEGMFLVRENAHDGYSLSFWHNNEHKHCRIKMNEDKFFLNQSVMFDTIVEMIDFYQTSEIFLGQSNYLLLKDPLPVKPDFF